MCLYAKCFELLPRYLENTFWTYKHLVVYQPALVQQRMCILQASGVVPNSSGGYPLSRTRMEHLDRWAFLKGQQLWLMSSLTCLVSKFPYKNSFGAADK